MPPFQKKLQPAAFSIVLLFTATLLQTPHLCAQSPGDTLLVRCDADIFCRPAVDSPVCSEAFAWNLLYLAKGRLPAGATAGQKEIATQFYAVTHRPGGEVTGWMRRTDVAVWSHRVAMGAATGKQQADVYFTADSLAKATTGGSAAVEDVDRWKFKAGQALLPVVGQKPLKLADEKHPVQALRVLRMQRPFAAAPAALLNQPAARDEESVRGPFQHAMYRSSQVPQLPALLDVVFVVNSGQPIRVIRSIGSAVESWQKKWKTVADGRFALAVVGSDAAMAPMVYPLPLDSAAFAAACNSQNTDTEPPEPPVGADADASNAVFQAIQQAAATTGWRKGALRHVVLLTPQSSLQPCEDKTDAAPPLVLQQTIDRLQPRSTMGATLHICDPGGSCQLTSKQLAAGNETPGTVRRYAAGVISQILNACTAGVNRKPPFAAPVFAISAPAAIAASLPVTRRAPPWSPRSDAEDPPGGSPPPSGYILRPERIRALDFQPFVLVEHSQLTMFAAYLEFTVHGLRRLESGSAEAARTLANMQRFEVNLLYGRPLSSPAAGPSGFAAELAALPAQTAALHATPARLASMSETDYTGWIEQAAACHTAIRKLLKSRTAWHSSGSGSRHTWLPLADLP